jgi:hypothetical protein
VLKKFFEAIPKLKKEFNVDIGLLNLAQIYSK